MTVWVIVRLDVTEEYRTPSFTRIDATRMNATNCTGPIRQRPEGAHLRKRDD